MRNKKFLLYPLALFFILFAFDKVFLLDKVRSYVKSDFTYIYYETREDLFEMLKKRKSDKKLMIILGSSRLLYFDSKDLEQFYPNWDIYNFSSAVTTPAYYYYYLEKILDAGIKPDFVLLESDPNQFNSNTPIFRNSNLTYSFDLPFIVKYANLFGKDYVSFYLGKYFFASSKNKPHLDTAFKRLTDPKYKIIAKEGHKIKDILLESKGSSKSLVENYVERDFGILQATSQRTIDWLFSSYKDSEMQYAFYEKILQRLSDAKIKTVIVWPQSSLPMQDLMRKSEKVGKKVDAWYKKVNSISAKYGFNVRDMDNTEDYYCNSFVDGGHIAKDCYHPFMRYAMSEYFKITTDLH